MKHFLHMILYTRWFTLTNARLSPWFVIVNNINQNFFIFLLPAEIFLSLAFKSNIFQFSHKQFALIIFCRHEYFNQMVFFIFIASSLIFFHQSPIVINTIFNYTFLIKISNFLFNFSDFLLFSEFYTLRSAHEKDYKKFAFARSIYVECVCQTFIGSFRSAFSRPR